MAEGVVVLEPGEERAQKIAKAMASQTAGDILRLVGEGPKTSTEISEQLSLPMNTAKYHIENLLEAGLINVDSTKYSIKGREVKVYSLTNQLLIVAPRHSNVRSLLLKYASLFGIVAFGSLVIAALSPLFGRGTVRQPFQQPLPDLDIAAGMAGRTAMETGTTLAKSVQEGVAENISGTVAPDAVASAMNNGSGIAEVTVAPGGDVIASVANAAQETAAPAFFSATPEAALAFFLGGVCVIFILVCYEVYLWRRMKTR